jgi:hypothetical protein
MEFTIYRDACWIRIYNKKSQQYLPNILGKYLFFSDNKKELITLAKKLLIQYKLYTAKVPSSNIANKSNGFGFVMCLYDTSDSLKYDLKQFETITISYRYFKSDEDTKAKKYSEQYLKNKS